MPVGVRMVRAVALTDRTVRAVVVRVDMFPTEVGGITIITAAIGAATAALAAATAALAVAPAVGSRDGITIRDTTIIEFMSTTIPAEGRTGGMVPAVDQVVVK